MATQAKPSLHDIASMPYPASLRAMRQHYNPDWGVPAPEGKLRRFAVEVKYTFTARDVWETEVNAHNEQEARDLAESQFDKADLDLPWDSDVDDATFKVVEAGEPRAASADTHPQGGDATQIAAPFMSGAVPREDAADAQPLDISEQPQ